MTSVLRQYSQIDPRVRFFYTVADSSGYTFGATLPTSGTVAYTDMSGAATQPVAITNGFLLKDLGREVRVYDSTIEGSPHLAIFRQVQPVANSATEGVQSAPFWIITWLASGSTFIPGNPELRLARVARTG
jgi:hypothetical protein